MSTVDGQAVAAGTPVSYSATMTNQDSSGCEAAVFDVAASVPAGWSTSSAVVSLSPGDSTTVKVSVTSAASAADGVYEIGISAKISSAVLRPRRTLMDKRLGMDDTVLSKKS